MKRVFRVIGILLMVFVVALMGIGAYIKLALPNTGAPGNLTVERTTARVERGKYLANHVAVCMDCHSKRDWTLYAGPLQPNGFGGGGERFDQNFGFPGVFYSRNITPAGVGTWTDGELLRAITTGVSKDGRPLFPLMAYPHYGKMDEEDIYSIIAYIRTLAPVENTVPAPVFDFPVNFLINTMPQKAAFTKLPAATSPAYGAYMVNAAGCVECHSKMDHGKIIAGTEFGGGMEFKMPAGVMRSPNITFDIETGIGNWSREAFVRRFKSYTDTGYHLPKMAPTDPNTPMPWLMYAGMKTSDLEAIYDYLQRLAPIRNEVTRYEKEVVKN